MLEHAGERLQNLHTALARAGAFAYRRCCYGDVRDRLGGRKLRLRVAHDFLAPLPLRARSYHCLAASNKPSF